MPKGTLITFEGIECSGKGVQSQKLLEYLKSLNRCLVSLLREPGGAVYGETLRAILKHPELAIPAIGEAVKGHADFPKGIVIPESLDQKQRFKRSPLCELFLFLAARTEFTDQGLKPRLDNGEVVIVDRCYDGSRAYQGGGRFNSEQKMITFINHLNLMTMQGITADITFFLDISINEMIRRQISQKHKDAFFETTCDRKFFERTRAEYLNIAQDEPNRFIVIDGEESIETIHTMIKIMALKTIEGGKQT